MNINNGALYFGAGIDRTQWRRDIDSMRRDILGLSQATVQQTRNMDSSFKNLSLGIAGAFSVSTIKSFVMELINVRGEFQKTEIAFTTMIGNATEAKGLMGQMVELAAKTPFSLQDVSSGAKQLLAFQIPASEVVDTLTRMGNIAAGLSVPIQRINLVYGQVKAKGKLMGDDLRQFTEAGIPMVAELAKKFGKTTAEISAMVSAGKIGFKDVKDVLFSMTNEGGMFFNLMEKQSQSLSGQIANLGDEWDQMLNKIGEANEGLLSDGIKGLTYLVEHYKDVIQIISMLVAAYGTYKAVLIATTYLQKLSISMETVKVWISLAMSIRTAADAQALFNLTVQANPYVLLATGIAAVVAALVYLRTYSADAKDEAEKLTSAMEFQKAVSDSIASAYKRTSETLVGSINKEISILKSSYSTVEMRKKAYESLIKLNKAFTGTVDAEYRATNKLSDAYDILVSRLKELSIAKGKAALLEELSKKKAQAELDLVFKEEEYENQRLENTRKRIENAKKLGSMPKSSMYYEVMVEKDINYSAYNPAKQARKVVEETTKQVDKLADDVARGIQDATKRNDPKLKAAWSTAVEEVASDGPKKGTQRWYEEEVKRLEEANKDLIAGSKEWNKNVALIDKYNDILKPKKETKDNRQLAELIPIGSIKELQRRANLLKEAMDTAVEGIVKLRKVDKYGNDKDKQGNPYFTGETITMESAVKLYEEYDAQIKSLQLKNFQERIGEAERQWNNYYKTAEYYGKESADAQYRDLFNGAKNYLDYLEKQESALLNLSEKSLLSTQQKQDLVFIREKIDGLKGLDTPFENIRKGVENAIKAIPSLTEQLDLIDKLRSVNKIVNVNNPGKFYEKDKYYKELSDGLLQQQQDQYIQFEKEHLSFEQRKTEITQRYDNIRLRIQQSNDSEQEKSRKTQEANKDQAKEISTMSWEQFQKTDAYVKAFGDLEKVGPRTLKKLRDQFKAFIDSEPGKALNIQDLKALNEVYSKLDEATKNRNPFEAIGIAVEKYKKKREELNKIEKESGKSTVKYNEKLDETKASFSELVEVSGAAVSGVLGFTSSLGGALGMLSEESQQTLKDVDQLVEGVNNAVVGYFSNNYGQMAGGIVQMVTSLSSLIGGDNAREKQIREWQSVVENLKNTYQDLQRAIEKTAGQESISRQKELINNLKDQQKVLNDMRDKEFGKKKADKDKISQYEQQMNDINRQIEDLVTKFKESVTTVEFKSLSQKLADSLIEAFGQGEDAAKSFDKVVEDVMKNAVVNALRIKYLEPVVKDMVDHLYSSMGYGKGDQSAIEKSIKETQAEIDKTQSEINASGNFQEIKVLEAKRMQLLQRLNDLKSQIANTDIDGVFDGLTQEEIAKLKDYKNDPRYKAFLESIKSIDQVFENTAAAAQGLKGDIKGITEKTAGALEGQINAMRIIQAEALKRQKDSMDVLRNQLLVQVQIEQNTRPLKGIYDEIKSMNSKIKNGLAGIP